MAKSAIQIGSGYLAHPGRQQPVSTSVLTTVLLHPARIAPFLTMFQLWQALRVYFDCPLDHYLMANL